MSSKSLSQIKVGDRVVCVASYTQIDSMGISHPRVVTGAQGTVTEDITENWADVDFGGDGGTIFAVLIEYLRLVGRTDQEEVEDAVCTQIKGRRDAGRAKYKTTMERTDLTVLQWVQHAQEEAMDFSIYLEKLKRVLKEKGIE